MTIKNLIVDVNEEDLTFAVKQDRYACAIVRAIQRVRPDAQFVSVNRSTIRFTLPDDHMRGQEGRGVRYIFATPDEAISSIIKPFDEGGEITPCNLILDEAVEAKPMQHRSREMAEKRMISERKARAEGRRMSPGTKGNRVRNYGRFIDQVISEAGEQA